MLLISYNVNKNKCDQKLLTIETIHNAHCFIAIPNFRFRLEVLVVFNQYHPLSAPNGFTTLSCKATGTESGLKMSATDHAVCRRWRGNDEGNKLLAYKNYPFVSSFQLRKCYGRWLTQSFSFKTCLNEAMQSYHQSDIVSDFQTAQICLTGSVTLQCGLSADKQ